MRKLCCWLRLDSMYARPQLMWSATWAFEAERPRGETTPDYHHLHSLFQACSNTWIWVLILEEGPKQLVFAFLESEEEEKRLLIEEQSEPVQAIGLCGVVLNAFELAFFVWVPAQFGVKLCYREHTVIIVTRVFLAVTTQVLCSYITLPCNTEYDADDKPQEETVNPMVDGGTEGFQGHARVIMPGISPCFECTIWLFPPQVKFPLCTLAEIPRTAAHCIEYAHLIKWDEANKRAELFGIPELHCLSLRGL
ncbi:uncharacterized protein LOC133731741 [Rosa rugosa]|uniref:uncharacterized protein LOC133731741 n=1 Tax=Rosa rugosa TaxID=74645 RepID=UPI002B4122E0|nr:uncharacterized protein LOC133731741 [Rosa rugosa]